MSKIFRKIRYDLMEKKKTGKYLKYAIGEIVLVMIGILLALQVNNWNENRKDLKKEELILRGLHKTFVFNLDELNHVLKSTRRGYKASLQLLELIKPEYSNTKKTFEIDRLLAVIEEYYTYDPTTGTIEEIINSGQLNIIQNDTLKTQISNWSQLISDAQKNIDIADDHLFNVLINYLMEHTNLRNFPRQLHLFEETKLPKIPPSNFTADYKPLVTSLKFENLVNQHAWNLIWIISEYMNIQSYLETTIILLENELQ